jgi:hypothetical protein
MTTPQSHTQGVNRVQRPPLIVHAALALGFIIHNGSLLRVGFPDSMPSGRNLNLTKEQGSRRLRTDSAHSMTDGRSWHQVTL